jgi:plastocyanin
MRSSNFDSRSFDGPSGRAATTLALALALALSACGKGCGGDAPERTPAPSPAPAEPPKAPPPSPKPVEPAPIPPPAEPLPTEPPMEEPLHQPPAPPPAEPSNVEPSAPTAEAPSEPRPEVPAAAEPETPAGAENESPDAAGETDPSVPAGSIAGRVVLSGPPPDVPPFVIDKDTETCGENRPSNLFLHDVGTGGVQDVFVEVRREDGSAPSGSLAVPSGPVPFDQKSCVFVSPVLAVPAGSTVEFLNSDDVQHNVKTVTKQNPSFNEIIPPGGSIAKTFPNGPEKVSVSCSIHPWMGATIVVHENPHVALTSANGSFAVAGLPSGTYVVRTWHKHLASAEAKVVLEENAGTKVEIQVSRK